MQTLFMIANTDYTARVNKRSYAVNEVDMIETWVDANYKTHGDLLRTKIQGSFTMTFTTASQYNAFVDDVTQHKGEDAKVPVTTYVGGRNSTASFNAFLDVSNVKPVFSNSAYGENAAVFGVTVRVEEE